LQLQTVAKGIETPQQLEWLRELGYERGQGYLFSRPLAPELVPAFISRLTGRPADACVYDLIRSS
jgi:EAL domain-containing protein (putative c-di-GMP-specific phosphodiesterase class I)